MKVFCNDKGFITPKEDVEKGYYANPKNDFNERYTPFYAVQPLLKYISKEKTIWCPCDKEWSAYVQTFKENNINCIYSHIDNGEDFLTFEPLSNYDYIITNPPFAIQEKILKRLYELDKPFAILLPLSSLQGQYRFDNFKTKGIQLLVFDKRIGFHSRNNFQESEESNITATCYFCYKFLPENLILEKLEKYQRALI